MAPLWKTAVIVHEVQVAIVVATEGVTVLYNHITIVVQVEVLLF